VGSARGVRERGRVMRVRWTVQHLLGGGEIAKAGEVADLDPLEAQRKIRMKLAEPADEEDGNA
jgi:hypothetical protein